MCDCKICRRNRKFEQMLIGLRDEQREFFLYIDTLLEGAETDASHYRAILEGKWPNSQEYLERALARITDYAG